MTHFANVEELNKVIRNIIIEQSQVPSERVLNSLSVHGEDLAELLEDEIYTSIEKSNLMILFELKSRESTSDMSMYDDENERVTLIRSFTITMIIYGDDSSNLANALFARFTSKEIRNSLHDSGIYLENTSKPVIITEYKNQTMWIRNDIDLDISCSFSIEKITKDNYFENISIRNNYII